MLQEACQMSSRALYLYLSGTLTVRLYCKVVPSKHDVRHTHQHALSRCSIHLCIVCRGAMEECCAYTRVVVISGQIRLIPDLAEAGHIQLGLVVSEFLHDPLPVRVVAAISILHPMEGQTDDQNA